MMTTSPVRETVRWFLVRRAMPRVLTVARALLPRRRHIYLVGFPPTEGNAVEVARSLAARYDGTVFWAQAPAASYLDAIGFTDRAAIQPIDKTRPRSWLRYATAELVLFTHGLYGEPKAQASKPTVNLWHGAGMKLTEGTFFPARTQKGPACDLIIAPNRMWGARCAELSGLTEADTVYSGYPRNDQLFSPEAEGVGSRLGVSAPFVVWLPSYRKTAAIGTMRSWTDSQDETASGRVTEDFAGIVAALAERGITTVIKPHPMDAESRGVPGAVVVDDASLEAAGVPLYRLLGASAGLITDVSSVWSDYLLLDRPIGFYFPDRGAYDAGRGFYPHDVLDWMPGRFLDTSADWGHFAEEVAADPGRDHARRARTSAWAGLVPTTTAADDLLDELRRRYPHLARSIRPREDVA